MPATHFRPTQWDRGKNWLGKLWNAQKWPVWSIAKGSVDHRSWQTEVHRSVKRDFKIKDNTTQALEHFVKGLGCKQGLFCKWLLNVFISHSGKASFFEIRVVRRFSPGQLYIILLHRHWCQDRWAAKEICLCMRARLGTGQRDSVRKKTFVYENCLRWCVCVCVSQNGGGCPSGSRWSVAIGCRPV